MKILSRLQVMGKALLALKDLAAKTGLTVTTVSRVLNNRGYISDETKKKVYEKAVKFCLSLSKNGEDYGKRV